MNLDTEGMRTNILTIGDQIVTTTFEGVLCIDRVTDKGPRQRAANGTGWVRFIGAMRTFPDNPDMEPKGVFYWCPDDMVHQVRTNYTEPGISALI
jgi:hypothetical protein